MSQWRPGRPGHRAFHKSNIPVSLASTKLYEHVPEKIQLRRNVGVLEVNTMPAEIGVLPSMSKKFQNVRLLRNQSHCHYSKSCLLGSSEDARAATEGRVDANLVGGPVKKSGMSWPQTKNTDSSIICVILTNCFQILQEHAKRKRKKRTPGLGTYLYLSSGLLSTILCVSLEMVSISPSARSTYKANQPAVSREQGLLFSSYNGFTAAGTG
jgi:hypothetical protein